ncbi:hypothetical protein I4U23_024140 [Adineta vaga]|nr:hypothetical protein I4U23_024140 [Adineta vaga]
MARLLVYPETLQFREVISYVARYMRCTIDDDNDQLPTLKFIGTVKLHGCNTAIVYQKDIGYWCQSRKHVLTLTNDHADFAQHMNSLAETFLTDYVFSECPVIREYYEQGSTIAIYGEWCGGDIQGQANIAIRNLPKMFAIFRIKILNKKKVPKTSFRSDQREFWLPSQYWENIKWHERSIYNVFDFPAYSIDIDFKAPELSQKTLIQITNKIEQQCPVGAYFNRIGCGEGVVWIEWNQSHGNLAFKVKGREYSVINTSILVPMQPPILNGIQEFVDYACTKNRMQQVFNSVLEELESMIDIKDFSTFLRWLAEDIIKEEKDTMNAAYIDAKDVVRGITIEYGNQLKAINRMQDDDLPSFERKIYQRFEFNIEQIKLLQLQWYDIDSGKYIDLDSETWLIFAKTEQANEHNVTTRSQRHLRLVHKQLVQRYQNTVDWVLNALGWLLPLIAVIAFVGDGVWILCAYDSNSKEQHNYAGLVSTILILFYYLQYDVKIGTTHPKLYLIYQSSILAGILTGDILYAYYYGNFVKNTFMMIIFIVYAIIDSGYVIIVAYFKWYRQYRVSMGLSIHSLFHLMSRLEVLLIILIPIFSTYDVISTNSIAFFILYEFFSHSYHNPDLIYSGCSRLAFWLLIILATTTVICENFEFVYSRLQQDTHDPSLEKHYYNLALAFQYASNISELCASIACYVLLLLQFFSKTDKRKRMEEETREI